MSWKSDYPIPPIPSKLARIARSTTVYDDTDPDADWMRPIDRVIPVDNHVNKRYLHHEGTEPEQDAGDVGTINDTVEIGVGAEDYKKYYLLLGLAAVCLLFMIGRRQ